ncbi:MAG: hypothetical protein AAB455_03130 [Patescibacteria group bacterium]
MKIKNTFILWLINTLILGGSLGLAYLTYGHFESTVEQHSKKYLTARAAANYNSWQEVLEASAADIARLNTSFVNSETLIKFIETLEATARESGVTMTLGEPTVGKTSLAVGLKARGSFRDLYRFVLRLENLPYQLKVERLDLIGSIGWTGDISLTLGTYLEGNV